MNRTVIISVVLALALAFLLTAIGYLVLRAPVGAGRETLQSAPEESVSGVATPDQEVRVTIAGTWRSDDDANFVRTFQADGNVVDTYEGAEEATTEGTWSFVTDPSREQAELPTVKDAKVIKIQFPEEVLYFALIDLTKTHLGLSYLSRGNTLSFTRVQ